MAHKETTDNIFSFTMPDKSLTVEALPEEEGFYAEYEQMDEETLAKLWQETNDAGELYLILFPMSKESR